MFFPSESELFFGAGIEEDVRMSNLDFNKVLPKITDKPFRVMKYWDLNQNLPLEFYNIILYHYPGFVGHWTLLCMDKDLEKAYFFDPYGRNVDTQWPYLRGYDKYETEYTILKNIIDNTNYRYSYNPYNIQGTLKEICITEKCKIVADNECGEIICFRILYKDLNDLEFFNKCIEVGPTKIFKIIKDIEKT